MYQQTEQVFHLVNIENFIRIKTGVLNVYHHI